MMVSHWRRNGHGTKALKFICHGIFSRDSSIRGSVMLKQVIRMKSNEFDGRFEWLMASSNLLKWHQSFITTTTTSIRFDIRKEETSSSFGCTTAMGFANEWGWLINSYLFYGGRSPKIDSVNFWFCLQRYQIGFFFGAAHFFCLDDDFFSSLQSSFISQFICFSSYRCNLIRSI